MVGVSEQDKIWMNGEFVDWKNAKVHVITHALHYGSGVFEGIRFYETPKGTAVFRLKEHTQRLFRSAKVFNLNIGYSEEEINNAILETIRVNGVKSGYIRPIIYCGYGIMGLNPSEAPVEVAIAVWPWGAYLGEKAVKVGISSFVRNHPKAIYAEAKVCGYYVNSIFASLEAKENGFDEALMLDYNGNVAEGPGENIFIVKDEKIFTPSKGNILAGITRDSIIQIARDEGFKVVETILNIDDVKSADEVFFTGTAAEVTGIGQIDETIIGDGNIGEITSKLREKYLNIVSGKNPNYENWLTYI